MASDALVQCTLQYPPEDDISDIQIPKSVAITGFAEKVDSTIVLAVGADQVLNLGSVASAKALYLSTDQDITVYINSAVTGFDLKSGGFFVLAGGASEITVVAVDVTVEDTSIRLWAIE